MAMKTRPQVAPTTTPTGCAQRVRTATLSKRLDLSKSALIRMAKDGLLPMPVRIGKLFLWDVSAVDAALSSKQGGQ